MLKTKSKAFFNRQKRRVIPERRLVFEALEYRHLLSFDFGDAATPYPVRIEDDGARHTPATWLQSGSEQMLSGVGSVAETALSDDGLTMAAGTGPLQGWIGVRVWRHDGNNWQPLGNAEETSYKYRSGTDPNIAMSGDGMTVAFGNYREGPAAINNQDEGVVSVFRWNGIGWQQLGMDLVGPARSQSGFDIDLSQDGNTLVIASPLAGVTKVLDWNGSSWQQLRPSIVAEPSCGSVYPEAVSISNNGLIVAIGDRLTSRGCGTKEGHVEIFEWTGSEWEQLGDDIDGATNSYLGNTVALNAAGDRLAVGSARGKNVNIYQFNGSTWEPMGNAIPFNGFRLTFSRDGNTVVVGTGTDARHPQKLTAYRWDGKDWEMTTEIGGQIWNFPSLNADGERLASSVVLQNPKRIRVTEFNDLTLGDSKDVEPDGIASSNADADGHDEDGVTFGKIIAGKTAWADVTVSGVGRLDAWVDFNSDGDWNDAGEKVFASRLLATGTQRLEFTVPSSAFGDTFARFRFSSSGGLAPTGVASDGEVEDYSVVINAIPTLNPIADLTIDEDAPEQTISLTGITAGRGDDQPLLVTAVSDNLALVLNPEVTYLAPATTGDLVLQPLAGRSGKAVVRVTVEDGGEDQELATTDDNATVTREFTITVTAINDMPTLDASDDLVIDEDSEELAIALSGISAGGNEDQPLAVTASSSDRRLIPDPTVDYASADATGTVTLRPTPDQFGTCMITITVEDGGLDGQLETKGDNAIYQRQFDVTVNPINDTPSLTAFHQSQQNEALVFDFNDSTQGWFAYSGSPDGSTAFGGYLRWVPGGNPGNFINARDTVTRGGGLFVSGPSSVSGDFSIYEAVRFDELLPSGSIASIRAGIVSGDTIFLTSSQRVSPINRWNPRRIEFSGEPWGRWRGAKSFEEALRNVDRFLFNFDVVGSVAFEGGVDNVAFLPAVVPLTTLQIDEDAPEQTVNLESIRAGGGELQSLQIAATSSNPTLIVDPTVTYTSAQETATLTFAPLPNQHGITTITVTVEDGGLDNLLETEGDNASFQTVFDVLVDPVNDPPTLQSIQRLTLDIDAAEQVLALTDISSGNSELQSVQISAVSEPPELLSDPEVNYTNGESSGWLTFRPAGQQRGVATIGVTIEDAGLDDELQTKYDNLAEVVQILVGVGVSSFESLQDILHVNLREPAQLATVSITQAGFDIRLNEGKWFGDDLPFATGDTTASLQVVDSIDLSRIELLGKEGQQLQFEDPGVWRMGSLRITPERILRSVQTTGLDAPRLYVDWPHFWQNLIAPSDVNNDGMTSARDALLVINEVARGAFRDQVTGLLIHPTELDAWPGLYYDQNADNRSTALDALRVINDLARQESPSGGEGELVLTYPGVSSGCDPIEASAGLYEIPLSIENVPRQRLSSRPCWFSSKQADSIQSDHEWAESEEEIGIDSLGSVEQLFGDEQFLETVLLTTR